jgi:uncharacterized membrane protein
LKNQLVLIVSQLLKGNNISFDKKELEFQIQSHPSYPSLHAITGVLNHFNIENIAAQVTPNSETLNELPECFVAQISGANGQNLVTVKKGETNYTIYDGIKKNILLLKEDFILKFTGIIVAVEKSEEKKYANTTSTFYKIIPSVLVVVLVLLFIYNLNISVFTYLHLLLSLIGIIISVAIVKQEVGLQTAIGNAFCSGTDEKKDCDAVLTSKGAEIIKGYKLSDFSLLYFTGLFLLTLILATNPSFTFSISLLAIPITIYSIYYQYAIVKKWCLLCLTIVGVLWLQAIVVSFSKNFLFTVTIEEVIFFLFTFSLVFLLWNYMKPFILELNTLRKEKINATKFQRNYNLFESMLLTSKSIETQLVETDEIIFGNINANLEITVITNPFCGHCKPVHKIVDDIIMKYKNEVKIIIRFNVSITELESDVVNITTRLLEIYKNNERECLTAMSDIYGGMAVKTWFLKWENCKEKEKFATVLKKEKYWCLEKNINFTPEILLNGKSYPKEYNKADLIYFMEDLIENN